MTVRGLLGNWDNSSTNDLIDRDGIQLDPETATPEEIKDFGITCKYFTERTCIPECIPKIIGGSSSMERTKHTLMRYKVRGRVTVCTVKRQHHNVILLLNDFIELKESLVM